MEGHQMNPIFSISKEDIEKQLEKNRQEAQYLLGTFIIISYGD
jgi:hypothetical protein